MISGLNIATIVISLAAAAFSLYVFRRAKRGKPPFEFKRRSDRTVVAIHEIGDAHGYWLRDPADGSARFFKRHSEAVEYCEAHNYEAKDE